MDGSPQSSNDSWRRFLDSTSARWLLSIVLVAIVVRVIWVAAANPDPRDAGRFDDTVLWYNAGLDLAAGDGFVHPSGDTPTGIFPPGYVVTLAGLSLLPGDGVSAARALNVASSIVIVVGSYYLASRLWNERAGLIAAAIMALLPSNIFFSSLLLRELVFAAGVVVLLSLTLAWSLRDDVRLPAIVALGLVAGLLAEVRPEGFLLALAIVVVWAIVYRSIPRTAAYASLLLLGMAALMVPWAIRNYVVFDEVLVLGTSGGAILYEAHQPESRGDGNWTLPLTLSLEFQEVPLPEREAEINAEGTSEALDYAVHNIPRELELAAHRFAGFYRGDASHLVYFGPEVASGNASISDDWIDVWRAVANSYYFIMLGVMLAGGPFWVRRFRREHALVVVPIAIYSLAWAMLFVGHNRYHFPLLSQFAILAAIGADAIWQRLFPNTS
jgi:4-amino-4-deoxy-L-arabinose transferase-like glycosyltransferase